MLLQLAIGCVLSCLLAAVGFLCWLDRRRKVDFRQHGDVTFVVPCYNAESTIEAVIASIFEVAGTHADVVVLDDASEDDSRGLLSQLSRRFPLQVYSNQSNHGKSATLNNAIRYVRHGLVCFVDADVIVNENAFGDALSRISDPRVGAVSCPYEPLNKGCLARMQAIEYNMLAVLQGSYNLFSAISLWGGFTLVRRDAFISVGGFSVDAITEDMDLAMKLNERGWKVEQSFERVRTFVPVSLSSWFRQKLRWQAGAIQAFLQHYRICLRNPIHIAFIATFGALVTLSVASLVHTLIVLQNIVDFFGLIGATLSLLASLKAAGLVYGTQVVEDTLWMTGFTLFSLPWVLPMIRRPGQLWLAWLVIPFSILYIPGSILVSACAAISLLYRKARYQAGVRAW